MSVSNTLIKPSTKINVANNYSAFPSAVISTGIFYWAINSQGTAWLPASLGGTYYNKGLYYSNGTTWESVETPFGATQLEVNAGLNNDKFVTSFTFENAIKWTTKQDTLTDVNLGNFMDVGLATKLTPSPTDGILARDILTNEAVEIPFSAFCGGGGGGTLITANSVFNFLNEEDKISVTILNASITNANIKSFSFIPIETSETSLDDFSLNGLSFSIANIIDNVSFDIIGTAINNASGNYTIKYLITI